MLTERELRFVEAYRGNGLEAAKAAGYEGSENTLKSYASKLLRKPAIADALVARHEHIMVAADAAPPALSPKHRRFVDAYIELGSGADAARRAGYAAISAAHRATARLARADVRDAIEVERAKREAKEIAQSREQQVILSKIARDEKAEHEVRIKAVVALSRIQSALVPRGAGTVGTSQSVVVVIDNGRGPSDQSDQ